VTKRLAGIAIALCVWSLPVAAAGEPFRTLSPAENGPHPATLLVPGCSGFAANNGINYNLYEERAAELHAAGYVVVFVDYVGRRMQGNCAHVSQAEVSADILEAATWARAQPGVDHDRISVIGWSYGAGGVLAALRAMPAPPPFTKAVLYYPVCRGAAPWSAAVAGLMLLGERDDIAFPDLCSAVGKAMPAERLRMIMYPGARHGFDMRVLSEGDRQPFGAPGYNADAAIASWVAVREFLK
jgi:dienelactone hydrolase